jgi:BirA family biotin operon repressor/biotin-[acetyl-CoA-carboxylase] ligase
VLEIIYLKNSPSTHLELIEKLQDDSLHVPVALTADFQHCGVGSRGNRWEGLEGNLFLSFALDINTLPDDLPKHAISIYFSYIMKETLFEFGSKLFLKWPNDFFLNDKKIGGTITKILKDKIVVCSIGINLKNAPKQFETIDINIDKNLLIKSYFLKLKQDIFWKKIFRKYKVEFSQSQRFLYYDEIEKKKVSLKDAKLQEDGSIQLYGRKVYSLR